MATAVSANVERHASSLIVVLEFYPQMAIKMIHKIPPNIVLIMIQNYPNNAFMKSLNNSEKKLISTLSTDGYNKLDISLLYRLIRHFNLVPAPSGKWGERPIDTNINEGDDMERMRHNRNDLFHHPKGGLSEKERDKFFEESMEIACRVDKFIGESTSSFETGIRNAKIDRFNCTQEQYTQALEKCVELQQQLKDILLYYGDDIAVKLGHQDLPATDSTQCSIYIRDPNMDVPAIIEMLEHMKKSLNEGTCQIKLLKAESGSLVLHVEINNLCFITKDSLHKAIAEFLRRMFTSISGSLDQHIMEVVLTECDSYIISDNEEENDEYLNDQEPSILKLDVMVRNTALQSKTNLYRDVHGFISKVLVATDKDVESTNGSPLEVIMTSQRVGGVTLCADCSFTTKLEDITVAGIGSVVTLSCCLDEKYGVRWYKDHCKISMNDKFKFKDEQLKHKLVIADIQEEDSGVYSCECGTTKTSCILKVEDNLFIKQLEDVTITTGQKLILVCELNAECKNVKWYKTNGVIPYKATITNCKIADSNAHRYKLEINLVKMENAGEYRCHIGNVMTTCNVTVKEIKESTSDALVKKTTLQVELNNTIRRLKMTNDEILNKRMELNRVLGEVNKKEIIIRQRETEIAEQGNTVKKKKGELENKENYMKALDEKQWAECAKKTLQLLKKELERTKQQSAVIQDEIGKLENKRQRKETSLSTAQNALEDLKRMMEHMPRVPSPPIANLFIKELEDVTLTTDQKLILACELNAKGKNVKWYKTNGAIPRNAPTTNFKIADSNAHRYKLEINLVKMEDAGEYRCHIDNVITTCNVTVKKKPKIKNDTSVNITTLLCEMNDTKNELEMTKVDIRNITEKLNRAETDVDQTEIIIKEKETEIAELRARLKDTEKIKESEIENKDSYIKELEDKNQKLTESVINLESICKDLKITKQLSAEMKEEIEKLKGEKELLEGRVSTLESYINDESMNPKELSKEMKVMKKMMEGLEKKKTTVLCSVS